MLNYKIDGDGVPIVLVGGGIGDMHSLRKLGRVLSLNYRVIQYDRRGSGKSPKRTKQMRVHDHAKDLHDLILELSLRDVHVVGHSYGANVALRCGLDFSTPIKSMTLVEPPILTRLRDTDYWDSEYAINTKTLSLIKDGESQTALPAFVNHCLGHTVWDTIPKWRQDILTTKSAIYADFIVDTLSTVYEDASLKSYKIPTLLLRGTESQPSYQQIIQTLRDALPLARLRELEGANHTVFRTHCQEAQEEIEGFISCL